MVATFPGSAQFLAEHREISEWFARIEAAAGDKAWVDFYVNKRNGKPHEVKVICVMKCAVGQEQGIPPSGGSNVIPGGGWQPKR